jgi:hypothetical protein
MRRIKDLKFPALLQSGFTRRTEQVASGICSLRIDMFVSCTTSFLNKTDKEIVVPKGNYSI